MKFTSGITRRLFTGALLTLCTSVALPQSSGLYTVEIVVFSNGGAAGALADADAPPAAADDDVDATVVPASRLNAATSKLRKGGYEILAHVAWTQAPTVFNSHHGVSTTQLGLGAAVSGKISLERGQNLNLRLDLIVENGGRRFRISEVRGRVKSGQIQYFDHPAVGVIAIINPVSARAG